MFLHGNNSCSLEWEGFIDKLSGFVNVAPCLRGHGYSSYYNPIKSIKDLAKDMKLLAKILFKDRKFWIIGS